MAKASKVKQSRLKKYFGSFNFLGVIMGTIFVCLGFLPSLLPRGWILQGVLAGVLFSSGYGVGLVLSHIVRKFNPGEPDSDRKTRIKKWMYLALFLVYVVMLILGFKWQQEVRELVQQPPAHSPSILGITLVAALITGFIILISRWIRSLFHWLGRMIDRYIPAAIAYTAAWLITVVAVIGILNGVILQNAMNVINEAFGVRNGTTDTGIVQPTDPHFSGSPESLIKWDTLGRQGRNFIGRVPTTADLGEFNKTEATQPIRIYSGLESADDTKERADLAVADLKRAGGYEREIIVVVTTTGTGWVDEEGVKPVEYMYNGDSAVVSMQYSYLPSWLSFLVDQQKAKDAGSALYNAVYNEALNIPEDQRPKIVVFGESLGSYGGETAFANEAAFRATSDGAVWAGPPNFNTIRKTATANRDPGSPEILPIYKQGEILRFAAVGKDFESPMTIWENPRAVYLQNPSDPIVWWSPHLLYSKPDWLSEPRGHDVSNKVFWLPIITFWNVTGDMVFSTEVPDGHGHKYGRLPTEAWGVVAPSDGWTEEKTQALKEKLGG